MPKHRDQKKNRPSFVHIGMLATPERCHQQGGVTTEIVDRDSTGRVYIERDRANEECALDLYLLKKRISNPQHKAGLRLREAYVRAAHGMECSVLGEQFVANAGSGDNEEKMALYIDALKTLSVVWPLLTPVQQRVLRRVCGYNEYASNYNDKETLVRGLDLLAKHWGIFE